jgi:hypothetical protein
VCVLSLSFCVFFPLVYCFCSRFRLVWIVSSFRSCVRSREL